MPSHVLALDPRGARYLRDHARWQRGELSERPQLREYLVPGPVTLEPRRRLPAGYELVRARGRDPSGRPLHPDDP